MSRPSSPSRSARFRASPKSASGVSRSPRSGSPLSVTTVDEPKGAINSGARSFTIYTNDQLVRSKDWNDVIVAYRNGAPLRVSDIDQAVTGPQDTKQAAWADGKRSVF